MKRNTIIIVVIVVALVGVGAYWKLAVRPAMQTASEPTVTGAPLPHNPHASRLAQVTENIPVVDSSSSQKPSGYYLLDGKVYFSSSGALIPVPDTDSFGAFPSMLEYPEWARDRTHVYYRGKMVSGADAETFSVFLVNLHGNPYSEEYGVDKDYFYLKGQKVVDEARIQYLTSVFPRISCKVSVCQLDS